MKRILKIIFFILLLVAVIICILWFVARNRAEKTGDTKPTFRQFLSRETAAPSKQSTGGELSEETPSSEEQPTEGTPMGTPIAMNVSVSQFTSGPLVPAQEVTGSGLGGVGIPTGTGVSGSPGGISSPPSPDPIVTIPVPACSDADLNIEFTAEEISRLNALQNEFIEIAGALHTDADVQAELANYTIFKAKADKITELYNYCQSKSPLIQTPFAYRTRVATPFWRNPAKDVSGYISAQSQAKNIPAILSKKGTLDPRDISLTKNLLEQYFKLYLW